MEWPSQTGAFQRPHIHLENLRQCSLINGVGNLQSGWRIVKSVSWWPGKACNEMRHSGVSVSGDAHKTRPACVFKKYQVNLLSHLAMPQLVVQVFGGELARQAPKVVEDGVGGGLPRGALAEVDGDEDEDGAEDVERAQLGPGARVGAPAPGGHAQPEAGEAEDQEQGQGG